MAIDHIESLVDIYQHESHWKEQLISNILIDVLTDACWSSFASCIVRVAVSKSSSISKIKQQASSLEMHL